MIIKALQFLMIFTLGLIIGIWLFSSPTLVSKQDPNQAVTLKQQPQPASDLTSEQRTQALNQLNQQIEEQAHTIAELSNQIKQLQQANEQLQQGQIQHAPTADIDETPRLPALEVLSMQDFESRLKDQFLDRFRGVAIELAGEQLADVRKSFNQNQSKDGWSAQYENQIGDFFSQNDPNRLHFIEEVNCNTQMCRVKVQPSDANHWKKLYSNLTQQEWYASMTLIEQSDNSNTQVYYIPKPFNP
jgi:hypothetical protein